MHKHEQRLYPQTHCFRDMTILRKINDLMNRARRSSTVRR